MGTINLGRESSASFYAGNGTVGTSEAKLLSLGMPVIKHVVIRAGAIGAETIAVGKPGRAAQGYVLAAGKETTIYVDNTDKIRLVGSAASLPFSFLVS